VVARGFTQQKGIDYNETFASTARSASWRVLIALTAIHGWIVWQADFITAYLNGILDEEIYIEQFELLKEFFDDNPGLAHEFAYSQDKVIKLELPLYGLK